jgi:KaiC/GvpD/RAD55 family RecA-like ATPase
VCRDSVPRIPIFEELTTGPIPSGSNVLVEFDPASEWYNAALTITVGWLQSGGRVHYNTSMQAPDAVRSGLKRLGLNPAILEKEDKLRIYDWYTMTLGGKSTDKAPLPSLKIQDLSPQYATWMKSGGLNEDATTLRVIDCDSTLARFNDERIWLEFILTRVYPRGPLYKATRISPVARGLHSDWAYRALESAADGIIDFKLDEAQDPPCNLVRIRNMRNVRFDGKWHRLRVTDNLAVALE